MYILKKKGFTSGYFSEFKNFAKSTLLENIRFTRSSFESFTYFFIYVHPYRCVSKTESWLTCHETASRDKLPEMAADWLWDVRSHEVPRTPNATANRQARRSRVLRRVPKWTKNKYL